MRKAGKERKMEKRLKLTEEEKDLIRLKDRLSKKRKRQEAKMRKTKDGMPSEKPSAEPLDEPSYETSDVPSNEPSNEPSNYLQNETYFNMLYKQRIRANAPNEKIEFDRIDVLLRMRAYRLRFLNGPNHEHRETCKNENGGYWCDSSLSYSNEASKIGMMVVRRGDDWRRRDFMRRAARDKDEEVLWWKFWMKGSPYKALLTLKKPEIAAKMKIKEDTLTLKEEERIRKEKELDEKGRWVWENEEYYWSIPDENGHRKSLEEYNQECEAAEPTLTIEEQEKKDRKEGELKRKIDEMWKKEQEETIKWMEEERRKKWRERERDRRQRLKEKLSQPIDTPKSGEKGEYEKVRDGIIGERHDAMKESGLFSEKELEMIKEKIM